MEPRKIGKYAEKGYTPILYTWTPETPTFSKRKKIEPIIEPKFCKAVAGSQGADYITTYCYDIVFNKDKNDFERLAYVECDYVE